MITSHYRSFAILIGALASSALLSAQDPRTSPPIKVKADFNGKAVTIDYSSPRTRGRKIFGELVPYNQVWRTGANEATALKTAVDLDIGGAQVPAGSYTLYSLPTSNQWKLIINKQTGQWGTEYSESQDLARVDLTKASRTHPLEEFTIQLTKTGAASATLSFEWDTLRLTVPVRAK